MAGWGWPGHNGVVAAVVGRGIPIEIDQAAIEAAGIDDDVPITMNLKGVSLASALRLMLGQIELAYTVRHEVLLITTQAATNAHTEVRVYNVSGLLGEVESTREVATVLDELFADPKKSPAAPQRKFLPYGRFLIVRATPQGHDEVAKVLRTMRTALLHDGRLPAEIGAPAADDEVDDSDQPPIFRAAETRQSRWQPTVARKLGRPRWPPA